MAKEFILILNERLLVNRKRPQQPIVFYNNCKTYFFIYINTLNNITIQTKQNNKNYTKINYKFDETNFFYSAIIFIKTKKEYSSKLC